jgi:hypothetical protein
MNFQFLNIFSLSLSLCVSEPPLFFFFFGLLSAIFVVNVGERIISKKPKRVELMTELKFRMESSTWLRDLCVMHLSSHICIQVSMANRSLLTKTVSRTSRGLKICLYLSIVVMRALMLVVAALCSPKNISHEPPKYFSCWISLM